MEHKHCSKCGYSKPITDFHKNKSSNDGYRNVCKECLKIYFVDYYKKNKEKIRRYQKDNPDIHNKANEKYNRKPTSKKKRRGISYMYKYGITEKDFNDMFLKQKGRCAICGVSQLDIEYRINIDHCHETGIVRGLLCRRCNTALGHFKDDVDIMQRAIDYLNEANNAE